MNFFIIFTAVLLIGSTYIAFRLIPRTSLRGFKKAIAYVLCYLPLINIPVRAEVRSLGRLGELVPPWLDVALFASQILMGTLSIVATVILVSDLILFIKYIITRFKNVNSNVKKTKELVDVSRRTFMQNALSAGVVAASAGLVGYGMSEAMGMPKVKHTLIPIKNLPLEFQGFKIVQLTDLHINRPAPVSRLEKIVEKVNALNADTIVITGDLSDSYPKQVQFEMEPLRKLRAIHGKYFVSGNHEYYTDIKGWLEEVARLELTNLHNEYRSIERNGARLLMCGVPDIYAPRMSNHISSPILAQEGSKKNDIKVLLAHQPQSIYEAVKANYDFQISGHTHGGQLIPWTYVTDMVQPYFYGLYKVENTQLYVSRGTGYWGPPLRIGAPPEIALLELVRA